MDADQLIALVKEQPAIYDGSYLRYRDRGTLSNIWKKIASQLNANENDCRDKWHNLRSNYMRVIRKEKLRPPGSSSTSRKWTYYDKMSFLYPYTEGGMSSSNRTENSADNSLPSVGEDNSDSEVHSALQELERDAGRLCDTPVESMSLTIVEQQPNEAKKRKLNSYHSDHQYSAEAGSANTDNIDVNDYDKMFLISLLPFIRQLEPMDNLEFRMEVQQILRRKLYP